jgi:hypothetical protein
LLPGIEPKSNLIFGIRTRYKTRFDFGTGNETWDSVLELELEFLKKQMRDEWFKTEG